MHLTTKVSTQRLSRLTPWIVAAAGLLATIVVLYPGQYPFDSAYQLWQARSGEFSDQSPVAMTALWSLMLKVNANPASLLCLNLAMFWAGLTLCVVAISEMPLVRAALLLALGMAPLTLVEMAHLLTDAHMAAVLMLATGLAAWGLTKGGHAPMLACLVLLIYTGVVRYNALAAVLPYSAVAAPALMPKRWRDSYAVWFAAIALGVLSIGTTFVLDRAPAVQRMTVWPTIALWDLAAVSVDSSALLLPSFTHGPGLTVEELRETGAFNPTANTFLFQRTYAGMRDGLAEPFTPDQLRELRRAWIDAVLQYPGVYARHRLRTFWLLIESHNGEFQGVPYFVGRTQYRNNPPLPTPLAQGLQRTFYTFAAGLGSSWIFAALPYLVLDVVALVLGWAHRDRPTARLAVAVSASALLYAASFLPLAPGADLRYLTWPIVAGPLALALSLSKCVGTKRNDEDGGPSFAASAPISDFSRVSSK